MLVSNGFFSPLYQFQMFSPIETPFERRFIAWQRELYKQTIVVFISAFVHSFQTISTLYQLDPGSSTIVLTSTSPARFDSIL